MRILRAKDFLEWANSVDPESQVTVTPRGDGSVRISAITRCARKRAVIECSRSTLLRNTLEQ